MKKLNILWIIALVMISSASALLNDGLLHVYTFDNATNPTANKLYDEYGSQNFSATNIGRGVIGKYNQAYSFSKTVPEWMNSDGGAAVPCGQNSTTVSFWVYMFNNNTGGGTTTLFYTGMSSYGAPFQSNIFYYEPRDGGQVQIEGAVGQFQPLSGKTLGQNINNSWHHIAYGINNSNVYIYFDGVLNATANITAPVQCGVTTLGNVGGASKYANMLMDEFYIWNRSLTSTEIATLASSTTAGYYPFSTGTQQNIQMLNAYDNGTVLSFSVIATNGTTSYSATTTDGIAEFYNLTGNWNFNVTIPNYYESNKIFNTSFIGSATYTNYSIQSLFNVTAYEIITNNSLSNFNATTTNAFNSTSGSSLLLITNNASQTITGRKSGYLTATTNAQAVSGQITSVSLAFGQYLVSINITDAVTNVYLQNFSINLVALNYSDYNITQNTTSYSTSFTLLAGNYTLLLDSDGYAVKEVNLTVNSNVNYTLSLYQTNSFFIVYKDEITKATINNVSLQLISSIYSTNLSTNNGTMAFNLLTPSDYTFRYQGGSLYPQREYYQTLVNKQSYNLTLYLSLIHI